jgi:Tol biopolymer transport system component
MITGRRAFFGDSELGTLAAILHKQPAPLGDIPGTNTHEIERIVARCLRKDPQRRWQTASDLKVALEDSLEELDQTPAITEAIPGAGRRWFWPAVAGVALVVALSLYVKSQWTTATASPSFQRLTFRRGSIESAKFAPDGQTILYSAAWEGEPVEIFATRLGSRESRTLGLPSGKILSISPDNELAILLGPVVGAGTGTLARAPLAGGAPREILENVSGADWGPQDSMVVARTVDGKNRLEFPSGKTLYESAGQPPIGAVLSPSGQWIAFFDHDDIGNFSVTVVGIGGERRVLSPGWRAIAGLRWSPRGDEVWFSAVRSGDEVQAVRAVNLAGQERVVAHTLGLVTIHDIARDGRVLLASSNSRISLHYLPPDGTGERDLSWFDTSNLYGISEDGKVLLFGELSYGDDLNPAIYLRKTDGSAAVRLGEGNTPSLSPDGKWVLCIKRDRNHSQLILLPTGAGETRVLQSDGLTYRAAEWLPGGRSILITAEQPGKPLRSYLLDLAGGKPRPITPEGTRARYVSPDGGSVVIVAGGKIYLRPLEGGEQRLVATLDSSESILRWRADGGALFLRRMDSRAAFGIYELDVTTGRKQFIRDLKSEDAIARISNVAITPDGRSMAYSFQRDLEDLYLVQGWK